MPKEPTAKEIKAQLKWLNENKEFILPYSAFGDDHHAAIDAQIDVLENDLTEDDIYDKSCDEGEEDESKEWTCSQREAALSVIRWLEGEEISPEENWKPLIHK